ncbi:putative protein OS=Streptomyces griseomycini OX=66895 GN=FHS37_007736 PE=4 SV=1 [Streptomyces griseomycini]|uniref:Uncharacterized protein n=1 Tax=Streptomyces griseomycini TaxID=66895 RepID=A0A7W7PYH3_9ACTN|nr:hypothetical protein [Streptomyces griseomycini]
MRWQRPGFMRIDSVVSAGFAHGGGLSLQLDHLVVAGGSDGHAGSVVDLSDGGWEGVQPSQTMSRTDRRRVSRLTT